MNQIAIWWKCFLRVTLRHPVLLLGSLGGVVAGVAITCALLLANARVLKVLDASSGAYAALESPEGYESVQWRSARGRAPRAALDACLAALPSGLSCRGIFSKLLRLDASTEVQVVGIGGCF